MAKTLGDFAQENSNFISIKDGQQYSAVYKGYKFIEKEVRGETKEYVRYLLEDLKDQKVRNLDSQSTALARKMDSVPIGSIIKIKREGEGFDTTYEVEYGEGEKKVSDDDIPVIEEEGAEIDELGNAL